MQEERKYLKVSSVARILDISQSGVYNLIRKAAIPSIRIGGTLRVPAEAIARLNQCTISQPGGDVAPSLSDLKIAPVCTNFADGIDPDGE
jgi:excisionase family DNA binding protein